MVKDIVELAGADCSRGKFQESLCPGSDHETIGIINCARATAKAHETAHPK